jgi:hypothetical protein
MSVIAGSPVMLAGSIPHGCSLLDTFVFVCWRYVSMLVRHLGQCVLHNVLERQRLMPKMALSNHVKRKFVSTCCI